MCLRLVAVFSLCDASKRTTFRVFCKPLVQQGIWGAHFHFWTNHVVDESVNSDNETLSLEDDKRNGIMSPHFPTEAMTTRPVVAQPTDVPFNYLMKRLDNGPCNSSGVARSTTRE